jgi:hypothetical protein
MAEVQLTRIAVCRARDRSLDPFASRRRHARRRGWVRLDSSDIGRRVGGVLIHRRRAVIGGQGSSPSPGPLASGASRRVGGSRLPGARPSFARLAVGPRAAAAPASAAVGPWPKRPTSRSKTGAYCPGSALRHGAILGAGEQIPMSQIAPAVGTAPAGRLRRPAAGGCGSVELTPVNVGGRRAATLDRRAKPSHHPANAATARSRSALETSNHSDMAAH